MTAFLCSGCGAQLRVPAARAGSRGRCPRCKQAVFAPGGNTSEEEEESTQTERSRRGSGERGLPRSDETEEGESVFESGAPVSELDLRFLATAQKPDEIGRLGPYRLLKVLGTGGMGIVFQAEDLQLGRRVALKALKPSLAANGEARKRFLREARAAGSLTHERIVAIYQVGEAQGVPYLAMQLLQGESLEDRLNRSGGRLELAEVLRIGRETAEGLAAAHNQGLVHRDIKPDNLWLEGPRRRVKILDFGLARAASEDAQITKAGMLLGTPAYMAPEQVEQETIDPRSDLFSLGCVLYRMSTGKLPFRGRTTMAVLLALASKTPRSPRSIKPDLPERFSDLVMRLLCKSIKDRPASARVLVEELEELEHDLEAGILNGEEEVETVPEEEVKEEPTPQPRKRKRRPPPPGRRPGRRRQREVSWEKRSITFAIIVFILLVILGLVLIGQKIYERYRPKSPKERREEAHVLYVEPCHREGTHTTPQ